MSALPLAPKQAVNSILKSSFRWRFQ